MLEQLTLTEDVGIRLEAVVAVRQSTGQSRPDAVVDEPTMNFRSWLIAKFRTGVRPQISGPAKVLDFPGDAKAGMQAGRTRASARPARHGHVAASQRSSIIPNHLCGLPGSSERGAERRIH